MQFLQQRELPNDSGSSSPRVRLSTTDTSRVITAYGSPREVCFPSLEPRRPPVCQPSGSFALNADDLSTQDKVDPRFPDQAQPQDSLSTPDICAYESRAEITTRLEKEQLRKEQTTVTLLSKHAFHWDWHKQSSGDREKRHRHGRPPSKQASTRAHFTDVFTTSPPRTGVQSDHERKKSALVRRLLHVSPMFTVTK